MPAVQPSELIIPLLRALLEQEVCTLQEIKTRVQKDKQFTDQQMAERLPDDSMTVIGSKLKQAIKACRQTGLITPLDDGGRSLTPNARAAFSAGDWSKADGVVKGQQWIEDRDELLMGCKVEQCGPIEKAKKVASDTVGLFFGLIYFACIGLCLFGFFRSCIYGPQPGPAPPYDNEVDPFDKWPPPGATR